MQPKGTKHELINFIETNCPQLYKKFKPSNQECDILLDAAVHNPLRLIQGLLKIERVYSIDLLRVKVIIELIGL